jgi:hypothetical protein
MKFGEVRNPQWSILKLLKLRDKENLGKFDTKSDEGIFLGYSTNSRAYRVFNKRTGTMMESINAIVDDEWVQRSISGEEKHIDSVDSSAAPTDIIEPSSKESLDESSPTTSGSTPITSEDEDIPANPPRQSRWGIIILLSSFLEI